MTVADNAIASSAFVIGAISSLHTAVWLALKTGIAGVQVAASAVLGTSAGMRLTCLKCDVRSSELYFVELARRLTAVGHSSSGVRARP